MAILFPNVIIKDNWFGYNPNYYQRPFCNLIMVERLGDYLRFLQQNIT